MLNFDPICVKKTAIFWPLEIAKDRKMGVRVHTYKSNCAAERVS